MPHARSLCACALLAASCVFSAPHVSAAESSSGAQGSSFSDPSVDSPINDPACVPSSEHPYPVVLIHGTSANIWKFDALARELQSEGYCTYGINYGREQLTVQSISPAVYGTADLDGSSAEVSQFIDGVLEQTGAEKVDIVAHSQGALHAKNYISRFGHANQVHRVVAMGASLHGTTLNGFADILGPLTRALPRVSAFFASTAAIQQLVGSEAMTMANSYPDTVAGVTYTSLFSPSDVTVTPNSASVFEPVPGADVVNLDAETACMAPDPIIHDDMPSNPTMMALTRWGLERDSGEQKPTAQYCYSRSG